MTVRTDLIKYDTPLNSAKISKMLNQLEFKLRVEKEYMQGIEKMAKLYQVRSVCLGLAVSPREDVRRTRC